MKILGAASLSSKLKRVLDIVWVLTLVGMVIIVLGDAVRIAAPDIDFLPITMSAELKKPDGLALIKSPSDAVLDTVTAEVAFKAPPRSLVLVHALFMVLGAAVAIGVLFHLRLVLASLTAGETFTRANARRLRMIALFSLGGVVVDEVWDQCCHFYLRATVEFAWARPQWPWPDLDDLFFALVLFVIAEAARVGAVLEEERALTV